MTRAVKGWVLIALFFASHVSLAQEPGQQVCASQLTELGARPYNDAWFPDVWEVPIGKFLPFLATTKGIKDLSPTSFAYGLPGSTEHEQIADLTYPLAVTCYEHLLFFTKNSGQYLVTIDLFQKKKLLGVGGLFGGPSQVWKISDAVYAMNLYYSDIAYEGLVLNVTTGRVLFYAGPSRYGDLKVALVVPGKGVLLESYYWGAPSMSNSVGLSLFDLTNGARRQTQEGMQSCLTKLPPNVYEWRFTLEEEGIVLHAKTEEREPPLAPSPNLTPTLVPTPPTTPPPSSIVPELLSPTPPNPSFVSFNLKSRANGVTSKLLKACRPIADKLLN